jgi:hypothetical protein
MNSARYCMVLMAAISMLGCQSDGVRSTGSGAMVRFLGAANQSVEVMAFDSAACANPTLIGVVGNLSSNVGLSPAITQSGNTLGMIGYPATGAVQPIERLVGANKPFVFSIRRTDVAGHAKSCYRSLVFTPDAGGQYEVGYDIGAEGCDLHVVRLRQGASGPLRLPEPTLRASPKIC